jgi:hypothetical protein
VPALSLKWKAPCQVSIDFRLELKFPPTTDNAAEPDFTAKPAFRLLANHAPGPPQYFDVLNVSDDQWAEWKRSGEQYDDRIVEVTWDKCDERWVFQRLRTDKLEGNHITVVEDLIRCIQRGVECHTVSSCNDCRVCDEVADWHRLAQTGADWCRPEPGDSLRSHGDHSR